MSKIKNSPSHHNKAAGRTLLNVAGFGCLAIAGVFAIGAVLAAAGFIPGLSDLIAGNGQPVMAPAGLDDSTSPELVLERRDQAQAHLNSYGWLDKEAEVVKIPIDQAMALVAERGLPVGSAERETTPQEAPAATAEPAVDSGEVETEAAPAAEAAATVEEAAATEPETTEEAVTAGEGAATAEPEATDEPAAEEPPAAEPTVNLAEVSFQEHVLPIFEQHCVQCHGGETDGEVRTEEGLSLLTHDDIMFGSFNGPVVEPGDVEGSYLVEQVVTGRMPKEGEPLSPAEIEIISAWVEAGAPDN